MDANSTTATTLPHGGSFDRSPVTAAAVLAATTGLFALALLVFSRRIVGALDQPAPAASLVAAALATGACCWIGRWLWRSNTVARGSASEAGATDLVIAWTPSVVVVLLTFGLSWPLERLVDWLVWMPLWVADALWRTTFVAGPPQQDREPAASKGLHAVQQDPDPVSASMLCDDVLEESATTSVLQQLTRLRDHDGTESIVGSLHADFAPGQRTAELYVGFCPPLCGIPLVEVEQSSGPPARLAASQVLSHGARVDIRLDEPASSHGGVTLDFYASSQGAENPAP